MRKQNRREVGALTLTGVVRGTDRRSPKYSVVAQSDHVNSTSIDPLLVFMRHSKLIQSILGLSRGDIIQWMGFWDRMGDENAQLLNDAAACLFGDPALSYPHMESLTLLVYFVMDSPSRLPILLRISFGNLQSTVTTGCDDCETCPMDLDYIGPVGAFKVHAAVRCDRNWQSLEDLTSEYRLRSTVFFSRWSPTAYLTHGLGAVRHLRQCLCDGAIHQRGLSHILLTCRPKLA